MAVSAEMAQRVGILLVLAGVLGYVWYLEGRGRWRAALTDRFVYGVPWGSLVSILLVLGVYLFVQSGIESWSDPAVVPFRSWSYSYVLGMLAAGFTHAGPDHLIGNMLGTVVLAPLVEYAWGHYPPRARGSDADGRDTRESGADRGDTGASDSDGSDASGTRPGYEHPPPGAPAEDDGTDAGRNGTNDRTDAGRNGADGGTAAGQGLRSRPLLRAFVVFPVGIVAVSILTSVFARGWSLGYSGTVFFLLGVAVVVVPLATIVAMVALSGTSVVFSALQTPVLTATTGSGAPSPPSWAAVNVQAHLLGFLLGVLVAFVLLRHRDRWPDIDRLALALVLVVLVRGLWGFSTSSGGTFTRWQGIGVIFVLFLAGLIVAMVAVDDRQLVGPVTLRSVVVGGLVTITLLVALWSVPLNLPGMDEDPVPDTGGIEIEDYTVTYAESVPHGRVSGDSSGVIVVSERRQVWTVGVSRSRLAHSGEATATVGGVGWREVVDVERSGWTVAGNDTVYAVDLEHGSQRVHAFQSDPKRAGSRIAGHAVTVVSAPGEFRLEITREGETVGSTAIPEANESVTVPLDEPATIPELVLVAEERDGAVEVAVEHGETRVLVAEKESYG